MNKPSQSPMPPPHRRPSSAWFCLVPREEGPLQRARPSPRLQIRARWGETRRTPRRRGTQELPSEAGEGSRKCSRLRRSIVGSHAAPGGGGDGPSLGDVEIRDEQRPMRIPSFSSTPKATPTPTPTAKESIVVIPDRSPECLPGFGSLERPQMQRLVGVDDSLRDEDEDGAGKDTEQPCAPLRTWLPRTMRPRLAPSINPAASPFADAGPVAPGTTAEEERERAQTRRECRRAVRRQRQ